MWMLGLTGCLLSLEGHVPSRIGHRNFKVLQLGNVWLK